jgi:hypothetical protein
MPRPKTRFADGRIRSFPSVSKSLQAAFDSLTGIENGRSVEVRNRAGKVVLRCWKALAAGDSFLDGKIQWMTFERLPTGW